MINPAIETNLCGELVEIYEIRWTTTGQRRDDVVPQMPTRHEYVVVRGRVCAVTTGKDGGLKVWIEILVDDPGGVADTCPGDVIMWDLDGSMSGARLRIVTKRQAA